MNESNLNAGSKNHFRLPRLLGMLWGTTNLGDIFLAMQYLTTRRKELVEGSALRRYEQAFARRVGVRHAISFASGRLAMYVILKEMGIKEGDEVLLQVPTHIVVANAIRYLGARPVFVDCDLNNYNMDLAQAEERITPRTRVLLVQHTYGIPAEMDAAIALARRRNLILVEDCVHALGATYHGQAVGSFGQAGFFSTEETKIISSTMGGMAVTDDDRLADQLRAFQMQCQQPSASLVSRYLVKLIVYHLLTYPILHRYTRPVYLFLRKNPRTHLAPGATSSHEMRGMQPVRQPGGNYFMRLGNAQAGIALRQLNRLNQNLSHRRAVASIYRDWFSRLGFHVPQPPLNSQPSYVRYPLLVQDRPEAMKQAMPVVALGQWFNTVLEEAETPEAGQYQLGSCPRAEFAAQHLVNVPTHLRVKYSDIRAIVAILAGIPHDVKLPGSDRIRETEKNLI